MPYVPNGPAKWPIAGNIDFGYCFVVASSAAVLYDGALTFGLEFDLIWMQRWSFITVLYICVRYSGILYSVTIILWSFSASMTNVDCNILYFIWTWTPVVVNAMLGVIMMTRIHAMYGRSTEMLIFLVVLLLVSTIATGVMTVIANLNVSVGSSGVCAAEIDTNRADLSYESLIPVAVWEILAFVLAIWIVIKHFRELRQSPPTGSIIGDCFTVLTKSHTFYFLAFAAVAGFTLGSLSATIQFSYSYSVGAAIYRGAFQIIQVLQMFVLGPRLILDVRECHAKLVARSDGGTGMTSIAFQAGRDALTGGDV